MIGRAQTVAPATCAIWTHRRCAIIAANVLRMIAHTWRCPSTRLFWMRPRKRCHFLLRKRRIQMLIPVRRKRPVTAHAGTTTITKEVEAIQRWPQERMIIPSAADVMRPSSCLHACSCCKEFCLLFDGCSRRGCGARKTGAHKNNCKSAVNKTKWIV